MGNMQARNLETRNGTNRRSSILWNFRYTSTVRRREELAVMVHSSKISIVEWLDLLDLHQYEGNLQEFSIVDDVVDITEKELKQCGVRVDHRQRMVNSLLGIRAKRRQSMNFEGQPLTSVPEPSFLDVNINRLQRWRQLQAKVQGFWKRWNLEYLSTLQTRMKWQQDAQNVAMDTLVVMKEPNQPPSKWLLGRVVQLHPGQDQRVRVVTVKTAKATYKLPITKIAVLPLN
ncbi:uncharacterized protein [Drosophila takahashii]|uniref:uncharacterized protein n=1 Tax=Drosophila takahashii TaxID=29030 RepID=UPI0038995E47